MLHQLERQRLCEQNLLAQGVPLSDAIKRARAEFPVRELVPTNGGGWS